MICFLKACLQKEKNEETRSKENKKWQKEQSFRVLFLLGFGV